MLSSKLIDMLKKLGLYKDPVPVPQPPEPGVPVRGVHYDVMVIDEINVEFVKKCLSFIPTYFEFSVLEDDPTQYYVDYTNQHPDWKTAVWPLKTNNNAVIIFNATKRNIPHNGYATWENNIYRAGVSYRGGERFIDFAVRIWHELLHLEGKRRDYTDYNNPYLPDQMVRGKGFDEFTNWLSEPLKSYFEENKGVYEHSPYMQSIYYTYLMQKFLLISPR